MARAADLVVATIKTLEEIRSNSSWDHLYQYTQDVAKLNNIPLPSTSTTSTARPSRSKQLSKRQRVALFYSQQAQGNLFVLVKSLKCLCIFVS